MPCKERLAGLVKHQEEEPPDGGGQGGRLSKFQLFFTTWLRLKKVADKKAGKSLNGEPNKKMKLPDTLN